MPLPFASSNLNIQDDSATAASVPAGIAAMPGITQRGEIGKSYFIKSIREYRQYLGEVLDHSVTLFPIYAMRALKMGAQLYITRVEHLANVNDPTSATAVKASATNGGIFAMSVPIYSVNIGADQIVLKGDYSAYIVAAQAHVVQKYAGGTANITVATVAYASGFTTITYAALVVGDATPGDTLTWSVTLTADATFTASSVGTWGNSLSFEIKTAASGQSGKLDIFVYLAGSEEFNESFLNFPASPTSAQIDAFNEKMNLIRIALTLAPITVCPVKALSGGTDDLASITNLDYIGSAAGGTGLRAFDADTNIVKFCVPDVQDNEVDLAILDYVKLRKDSLAVLACPPAAEPITAIEYRNQTGAFSGTKIDDWRARMLFGGLKIISPYDNSSPIEIGWIGDLIGLSATKDRSLGAWISVSGEDSQIQNAKDIIYNLYTFARAQEQIDIAAAGLIPIIKKDVGGVKKIVIWGNSTLQVADSQLSFANNAELCIYIANGIKPFMDAQLFKPNDPLSWKTIYRKVAVFMQDIETRRGVRPGWSYEGDQNADTLADATINLPATIALGMYIFFLYFTPIGAINNIEGNAVVTADTGVQVEQFA